MTRTWTGGLISKPAFEFMMGSNLMSGFGKLPPWESSDFNRGVFGLDLNPAQTRRG
jgi:hypothetical protein